MIGHRQVSQASLAASAARRATTLATFDEGWRRAIRRSPCSSPARPRTRTDALAAAADSGPLSINPIVYSEVSVRSTTIEALEEALPSQDYRRTSLPWDAAFLAGKAFVHYRRNPGTKSSTLPDFFIGAHAAVADLDLLTRDVDRYRTYVRPWVSSRRAPETRSPPTMEWGR